MLGPQWESDEDHPAKPKKAEPDEDFRHYGEAARPRSSTLRALREIAAFHSLADMLRSEHAWSGPSVEPGSEFRFYSSLRDWRWRR